MATKYTSITIFTKKGNLLPYLNLKLAGERGPLDANRVRHLREQYSDEREIQLILLTRYEGNKLMCKVKCPISPLPVKGEFEAPCYAAICSFLKENGWSFKQKFYPRMFE